MIAQLSSRRKAIAILGGGLIVLLALTERSALQMVAALATCLVLPGLGWARKLRSGDRGDTFAMTLVISISATVLISTAMAVSAHWSVAGGLAVLSAVTLLGFVPYRALAAHAGAVLPAPVVVDGRRPALADWYDDARRRADHQRRLARRAAVEDSERWQNWYARLADEVEAPQWETGDRKPVLASAPDWSDAAEVEVVAPAAEPAEDADLAGLGDAWDDWYAAARRRDDIARRDSEAADRKSGVEWREWYRRAATDAPLKKHSDD